MFFYPHGTSVEGGKVYPRTDPVAIGLIVSADEQRCLLGRSHRPLGRPVRNGHGWSGWWLDGWLWMVDVFIHVDLLDFLIWLVGLMLGWVDAFVLQMLGCMHCWYLSIVDHLMISWWFFLWILMYSSPGILLGCTPVCRALWTCASLWKKPSSAKPSKRQREQTKDDESENVFEWSNTNND